MSDKTIIYCYALANFEKNEENYALNNGWAIDEWDNKNPRIWFQARQTRINISKFKNSKSLRRSKKRCADITYEIKKLSTVNVVDLEKVYKSYLQNKNFKNKRTLVEDLFLDSEEKHIIEYKENKQLHAFTVLRFYETSPSMSSIQFCWDYHNPKLYLGIFSVVTEVEIAKQNNIKYLYLMPGYETFCIYKSSFRGFEFWDGQEWSDDKKIYKLMCEKDSEIKTISDLDKLTIQYEKEYFDR